MVYAGAVFDAHVHIIDPRFPLVPNDGYLPSPFTVTDYRSRVEPLDLVGGAVVSGSFQAFDTGYLLDALDQLGPGFVGVTNLPVDAPDAVIRRLDAAGVRAVRVNLVRGGSLSRGSVSLADLLADLQALARRVHHVAMRLVEGGAVVKATGLGRIDHQDPARVARAILAANPAGLVFGTDLPSTRTPVPYSHADLDTVLSWLDPAQVEAVTHGNARRLYRI